MTIQSHWQGGTTIICELHSKTIFILIKPKSVYILYKCSFNLNSKWDTRLSKTPSKGCSLSEWLDLQEIPIWCNCDRCDDTTHNNFHFEATVFQRETYLSESLREQRWQRKDTLHHGAGFSDTRPLLFELIIALCSFMKQYYSMLWDFFEHLYNVFCVY